MKGGTPKAAPMGPEFQGNVCIGYKTATSKAHFCSGLTGRVIQDVHRPVSVACSAPANAAP